ncbi:MAG: hypothetical protein M1837_007460 [Sclerophora amabilis]|nr:MAG: hypothetical protein M1837_007460 [Sclerophora amabilis]
MPFAQLVIGPPGSGKSTYCDGMHQFMSAIGRKSSVVNLDPANDRTSYPCALDVRDLVTLDEIMSDEELGPNGAVLYALEELENNFEWLEQRLKKLGVLHLTDSYSLTLPSLYISTILLSLRAMLQMDLPHLNVLTKVDKLSSYAPLAFNLDFYTEVQDLSYLLPVLEAETSSSSFPSSQRTTSNPLENKNPPTKFSGLNKAIVELVEDFGLVGFETLAVEDKRSMMKLLQTIDRAGGYAFGGPEGVNDTVWQVAMREQGRTVMDVKDVQERWIDAREEYDEQERRDWEEEARIVREKARDNGSMEGQPGDGQRSSEGLGEDLGMPVGGDSGIKVVHKKSSAPRS